MNKNILIDTDIVIDFLRGNNQAVLLFKTHADAICFSAITVAEIYAGIKGKKEEVEIERLFSIFPVIATTKEIASEAGKLVNQFRPSHSVEIPDGVIAATCIVYGAELKTLNIKHYPMFKTRNRRIKKRNRVGIFVKSISK